MATMKSVRTAGVGKVEVVDVERPAPGPADVLVRVRACGICGTDVTFLHMGGVPSRAHLGGELIPVALGHEPAGEIVEVGAEVSGLAVGTGSWSTRRTPPPASSAAVVRTAG
ncbi:alcohol dehydrogenase catalytic domain-containing protein [Streptomyces akebiae]|uniref:alcohol dehydrogenase catalytic domain-containing protein n=1 Tax=Streptomyces akebiae TaxID=2865673 RepID=UPI002175A62D|nr:alcohol dehydrogenase catalytic domain-containing protein [Streptomyces akebiae]